MTTRKCATVLFPLLFLTDGLLFLEMTKGGLEFVFLNFKGIHPLCSFSYSWFFLFFFPSRTDCPASCSSWLFQQKKIWRKKSPLLQRKQHRCSRLQEVHRWPSKMLVLAFTSQTLIKWSVSHDSHENPPAFQGCMWTLNRPFLFCLDQIKQAVGVKSDCFQVLSLNQKTKVCEQGEVM